MIEQVGSLWETPNHLRETEIFRVIPTNGIFMKNGDAVMGAGVALEAKIRYPQLPKELGSLLRLCGNHVFLFQEWRIITFPTKNHWGEPASLDLIKQSTEELYKIASNQMFKYFYSSRVGCGLGGCDWDDVRPIVSMLPNNVYFFSKE